MFTTMKLFFTFQDEIHPDEFPRIITPSIAISRLYAISIQDLLSRFSGVNGSRSISHAAGANPNQTGGNLKVLISHELKLGSIIAVETRQDQLATIGPFYVTDSGYLRNSNLSVLGYPVDRIIRRYEEMVGSYGKRAKPTVFPAQVSRTQAAQKVEKATQPSAVGQTTGREPITKAERWQQRQNLIGRGERCPYPDAQLASKRLAANNIAVENAKLSENVYKTTNPLRDTPDVPEGWKDISNVDHALTKLGLKKEMLFDNADSPNFLARVYQPDSRIFGKVINPTVVFRGSRVPRFAEGTGETVKRIIFEDVSEIKNIKIDNVEDWRNNIAQSVGADSEYYKRAVKIGKRLKNSPSVSISGHSLGGSMASVASIASGKPAWTFNAAGVNSDTVEQYGGSIIGSTNNIQAYRVQGELLTTLQEVDLFEDAKSLNFNLYALAVKEGISSLAPDALGIKHTISGGTGSLLDKHGIDQTIKVIEKQKDDDIATIRSRL